MKLYLIDGSSFLYRSYYALKPMHTSTGKPVQATFGFCRIIKKLTKDFSIDHAALVWDSKGETARHKIYSAYKQTRQAAPSDLFEQKEDIQEFAHLIGLHQVAMPGVEADDLMASLAKDFADKGHEVIIVSSDKDMRQIVSDHIIIFDPFKNEFLDVDAVEKKYGFPITKLPFYFALIGDASDNIPGVGGIGPKGAEKLVTQFESLEELYANIDKAGTARTQELLRASKDNAFLSYQLFLLRYYQTDVTVDDLKFDQNNFKNAAPLFEQLQFTSLLKEIKQAEPEQQQEHTQQVRQSFAEQYGYHFKLVVTRDALEHMCHEIREARCCALDTETNSLAPLQSTLVGISFCCQKGTAYYIPVGHTTGEQQLPKEVIFSALKPILEDEHIEKYLHHTKFDQLVLYAAGINLKGVVFDTVLAADLVKGTGESIGLKSLSSAYFSETMMAFKEAVNAKKLKTFDQVPLHDALDYAAADAHQTFQLVPFLKHKLYAPELGGVAQERLYYDIELPLVQVLCDMEKRGIFLDVDVLREVDKHVSQELHVLKRNISESVGMMDSVLNLNSPQQVSHLLFEILGLKPLKKTAGKKRYSTDHEVLIALSKEHPVPGYILQYRELFKLKSTYIDALPTFINPTTGRIHTTFRQTGIATGRLSSSDPNMQNIPADMGAYSIRTAFKAAPGKSFIAADYSQMELRVLAHVSGDEHLTRAFLMGEDIHTLTAQGLFDVSAQNVTQEQRQIAKRINFSIMYGVTPHGLSQDLGISHAQAKEYIEKYMAQYPGVKAWIEHVISDATQHGYVTTWHGRRRYVPELREKNHTLQQAGQRIAVNTIVQGTAAEIMKLGMLHVQKAFEEKNIPAHMILQIHDELLLETHQDFIEATTETLQSTLQSVVTWRVPLLVNVRSGKTWFDVSK